MHNPGPATSPAMGCRSCMLSLDAAPGAAASAGVAEMREWVEIMRSAAHHQEERVMTHDSLSGRQCEGKGYAGQPGHHQSEQRER